MSDTPVLAFDTSAAHCAAVLLLGDRVVAARYEEIGRGQAERLFPMLEEVLAEDGLPWSALGAIAVGIGPGNFTGIRISVSAARGLALALGIPAIGVSNFEVMRGPNSLRDHDPQLVSIPGPRESCYLQLFENGIANGAPRLEYISSETFPGNLSLPSGTTILGQNSLDIATLLPPVYDYSYPQPFFANLPKERTGEIIARLARQKLDLGEIGDTARPLYIKAADAAPSRDTPPVILT